jgi:hypothetical protein
MVWLLESEVSFSFQLRPRLLMSECSPCVNHLALPLHGLLLIEPACFHRATAEPVSVETFPLQLLTLCQPKALRTSWKYLFWSLVLCHLDFDSKSSRYFILQLLALLKTFSSFWRFCVSAVVLNTFGFSLYVMSRRSSLYLHSQRCPHASYRSLCSVLRKQNAYTDTHCWVSICPSPRTFRASGLHLSWDPASDEGRGRGREIGLCCLFWLLLV